MKALVKERPEPGLSLLDLEKPKIENPGEVLFRVEYCGIGSGKKSALDLARERAAEIVATHEPTPALPSGKEEELDRILEEAIAYYRNKSLL